MAYSLDPIKSDCYENSTVLINKFDIRDQDKLDYIERDITRLQIYKAITEIQFKQVDLEFYKSLHRYVFGDIYSWAGELRRVDISKKGTSFCHACDLAARGKSLFLRLQRSDYLKAYSGDDFINEFTELYCDLNYLHPFREGNGRIQRLFLNMLLMHIGRSIDFSRIDRDLLMIATIKSVSGDAFYAKRHFPRWNNRIE